MCGFMTLQGNSELTKVVFTRRSTRGFPNPMYRWDEKCHQHSKNAHANCYFNLRETKFCESHSKVLIGERLR